MPRENEQDMLVYVYSNRCYCPTSKRLEFSDLPALKKNTEILNFMKIRRVEADLFHAYR
jgi:hypothetical protein